MSRVRAVVVLGWLFGSIVQATPRIDTLAPSQGPTVGGTEIVLAGAGFNGATVLLDNTPATPLAQTDAEIRLRAPPHDNGYLLINVRSSTGNAYGEFLYVPPRLEDLPAGSITTIAGIGRYVRDYGPALQSTINPSGLALDASGNLYVADPLYDKVLRVRPDGTIERVTAGGGRNLPIGDNGPAVDAKVWFPLALAVDPAGNLYIPDHTNRIRKVNALTGIITTLAGDGIEAYAGDNGPASQARVGNPTHIAADANDVFFIDFDGARIRRIHFADGRITTFAGTGTYGFYGDDGPATLAQFNVGDSDKGHLALDPAGNLYLADSANRRIRRIDRTSGIISTFYRLGQESSGADNVGEPRSLAIDAAGNVYVGGSGRIIKLSAAGAFVRAWGRGSYALPPEGAPSSADFSLVTGLAVDPAGASIFLSDGLRVRRIDVASDRIFSVAGSGPSIPGETGPALAALVNALDVTFDHDGNLLIADANLRLRRMDRTGQISTIAGNGSFVGEPAPTLAPRCVLAPMNVEVDRRGEIEIALQSVIGHIDAAGILREIVGRGGAASYSGDGGPAGAATLCQAWDCLRDPQGNLLIADTNNNRIRRIDAQTGIITTIAGNGGPASGYERYGSGTSGGDGGTALNAAINAPYGLALDSGGNLFIAEDAAIRKVDAGGRISTFSAIRGTTKLVVDSADALYATIPSGVVRFDRSGNRTWLAGTDDPSRTGFSGDGGPATQARVLLAHQAAGLALDVEGNLYFCDDYRIRAIRRAAPPSPPVIFTPPASRAFTAGATATLTFPAIGASPLRYRWQNNGTVIADSTSSTLAIANFASANAGIYTSVLTNGAGTATTPAFIVGLDTTSKVADAGQVLNTGIVHPNGNIFDQVLATGAAETITADPGKVTRTSYIDLNDDIVQVEFSGAGTLSVVLAGASGPAAPLQYTQAVAYMKGHAGIVITGANETTNVSVFTVGRATAFDPTGRYSILLPPGPANDPGNNGSPLFVGHATTNYDGIADIAFIAIASTNGKFGGLRAANASCWSTTGYTGVYAPGVHFTGPVNLGDINAQADAVPVLQIGSADGGTRITGGDLKQDNGAAVRVSGITQLLFVAGATSANRTLPAQTNKARLEENGMDVTAQVVVNP